MSDTGMEPKVSSEKKKEVMVFDGTHPNYKILPAGVDWESVVTDGLINNQFKYVEDGEEGMNIGKSAFQEVFVRMNGINWAKNGHQHLKAIVLEQDKEVENVVDVPLPKPKPRQEEEDPYLGSTVVNYLTTTTIALGQERDMVIRPGPAPKSMQGKSEDVVDAKKKPPRIKYEVNFLRKIGREMFDAELISSNIVLDYYEDRYDPILRQVKMSRQRQPQRRH